jgi:hypothetical protein
VLWVLVPVASESPPSKLSKATQRAPCRQQARRDDRASTAPVCAVVVPWAYGSAFSGGGVGIEVWTGPDLLAEMP